jgi:hypothetical protein
MKTIWKFPLAMVSPQRVDMPEGAQILTVQAQGDFGCIWALVDPDVEKQSHYFEIYGTGQVVTDDGVTERPYVGTFQTDQFVWHVFERVDEQQ